MSILTQFIFRLSFGLAVAMALTPWRQVTSGYYRVHLYVLLGLNVLAALVAVSAPAEFSLAPPLVAALLSYAGAVAWLYEKPRPGTIILWLVALATISGALLAMSRHSGMPAAAKLLFWLDPVTGGLVLGVTIAAMFLGHWYLNTPTMQLAPLRRLVLLMTAAIMLRAAVCGTGLAMHVAETGVPDTAQLVFLSLRWLAGLVGALVVARMSWQILRIPNTQAATGVLYVGVIVTFVGELTSMLLSHESAYPL